MKTIHRTLSFVVLTLALFLMPSDAFGQRSGFFFRGNVGAGYTNFSSDIFDLHGGSGLAAFDFGAFVSPNLAVYGELFASAVTAPTIDFGTASFPTTDDITAAVAGVGVGITYYTRGNVSIGGTIGIGSMTAENETSNSKWESDSGIALSLIVGKEWLVSEKWALGVAGHIIGGSMDAPADNTTWTAGAVGVDFTFTYVAGGFH